MGIFRPDPTCPHGKPLQVSCHKCTPRQRAAAEDKASGRSPAKPKDPDPRRATTGTFRTGLFGRTTKTSRNARKR